MTTDQCTGAPNNLPTILMELDLSINEQFQGMNALNPFFFFY